MGNILRQDTEEYSDALESILIRRKGGRIIGGCVLDLSEWPEDPVRGGHMVIKKETDGIMAYKPSPVEGDSFSTIPTGWEYAGVLVRSVTKTNPFAAVQYDGEINDNAMPYSIDGIRAAVKTALPSLYFMHD